MPRFGLPTVLGAGAAGAYGAQQLKDNGLTGVWTMLPSQWLPPSLQQAVQQSGDGAQVTALQGELRRLTATVGDLAKQGNRPTVVQVGGKQGWTVIIIPAAVGGAVLYAYCRLTGTSVWDLLYVSRSSLTAFRTTVQESMTKVWEEMKKQKEEIFKVVAAMGRKQDELKDNQDALMAKQDQMDERLRRVDDACYQLDAKANHTIQRVEKMDNRLQDVHTGVQAANQGIYMLVSAVSEVTQKIGLHNSRTAQALHRYVTNGPAWQAGPAPALLEQTPAAGAASASGANGTAAAAAGPSYSAASAPAAVLAPAAGGASVSGGAAAPATGVATPGGLRGLMGFGGVSGNGNAAAAPAPGLKQQAFEEPVAAAAMSNGSAAAANGASCRIEDVTEQPAAVPVVAAAPKGVAVGGLGMLRGFN